MSSKHSKSSTRKRPSFWCSKRTVTAAPRVAAIGSMMWMPSCTSRTRMPRWKRTDFRAVVPKPLKCSSHGGSSRQTVLGHCGNHRVAGGGCHFIPYPQCHFKECHQGKCECQDRFTGEGHIAPDQRDGCL